MERPTRKTVRLRDFDYTTPGAYFVTICCAGRKPLFGSIAGGIVALSALGRLVEAELDALTARYSAVAVDISVVMPNHLHLIVWLGAGPCAGKKPVTSLSNVVSALKAGITRKASIRLGIADPVFQPRFYEHVIRHEGALTRIREYIRSNPLKWSLDHENPDRVGEDEFHMWLSQYCRHIVAEKDRTP